jgi:hypothetical protein
VLGSSDQNHVQYDTDQNQTEAGKGKKPANFQQVEIGLSSLRQSKFDPERQKQTQ